MIRLIIYLFIAGIVSKAYAVHTKNKMDSETSLLVGMLWPISLPFLLGVSIVRYIVKSVKEIKK